MSTHFATARVGNMDPQDMASSSVDRGPVAAPKQADRRPIAAQSYGDRPSVVGPKYRLRTLASLDGRTLGARRARQLAAEFIAQLGSNVTATKRRAAEHAAMLIAISEDLATRQLAGEPISLDGLI